MMALKPAHPNFDAWLVTQLLIVLFHHYAYATLDEPLERSLSDSGSSAWQPSEVAL